MLSPALTRAATSRARRVVRRVASHLPAPRDEDMLELLRSARVLVTGRRGSARPARPTGVRVPAYKLPVGPPPPPAPALPPEEQWRVPKLSLPSGVVHRHYTTGRGAQRYDLELFEQLNAEYAGKPIAPQPRAGDAGSLMSAARRRVAWAHRHVDLLGKTALEIGCGNGYEVWMMGNNLGCDAHGVDVNECVPWAELAGDRVHYVCADLTRTRPFPAKSFDRVVSYAVWEHVVHPHALLEETYRLLRPGGLAWIRANLYAGPKASHRYREIYFPWPHLLFSDDVIREWDAKNGRVPRGASWVNRLSWNHYERYIAQVGFRIRRLSFQLATWDEDFYRRFEDVLGRFPVTDLKRDFFLVVLEKPAGPPGPL